MGSSAGSSLFLILILICFLSFPAMAGCGELLWEFNTSNAIQGSPSAANGIVYTGSGNFYALNMTTGEEIWQFKTTEIDPTGTNPVGSAVAEGIVYVGLADGTNFYALNATTGEERWRAALGPVGSIPAVADGIVYITTDDGYLHALNASTGDEVWNVFTESYYRSPAVVDGGVYAGTYQDSVVALNASTGNLIWVSGTSGPVYGKPTVSDEMVFVASYYIDYTTGYTSGVVHSFDRTTGVEVWSYIPPGELFDPFVMPFTSGVAAADGIVYSVNDNGILFALDAATGEVVWIDGGVYPGGSTPAVVDGVLYTYSDSGLRALNARTGEDEWTYHAMPSGSSSPIVADGMVYVGNSDAGAGELGLYALETCGPTSFPLCKFSMNKTAGVAPFAVSFTDESVGLNITGWYWEFGDGNTSTEQNPTHIYEFQGNLPNWDFEIRHSVTNASGTDWQNLTLITVYDSPPETSFTITSNNYGLDPLRVNFNDTSAFLPDSWFWDFGDGGTSTGQNTNHTYELHDVFDVNFTACNSHGCNITILRNAVDTQDLPLPAQGCTQYTNGTLSASSEFLGGESWEYHREYHMADPQGPALAARASVGIHGWWENIGPLPAWLMLDYGEGVAHTITNFSLYHPSFMGNYGPEIFTMEGSDDNSTWDVLETHQKSARWAYWDAYWFGERRNYSISAPGDYRYYRINITGAHQGENYQVEVDEFDLYACPIPLTSGFSANPKNGTRPLEVRFTDRSTGLGITGWYWEFGDGNTSTDKSPVYIYPDAGTFTVRHSVTNATGTAWRNVTDMITVTPPPPVASFTAAPTSGTAPLNVTFTDRSTNNPTSWNWSFGDGTFNEAQNPVHTYGSAGIYTVTLTVVNGGGSNTSPGLNITVNGAPPHYYIMIGGDDRGGGIENVTVRNTPVPGKVTPSETALPPSSGVTPMPSPGVTVSEAPGNIDHGIAEASAQAEAQPTRAGLSPVTIALGILAATGLFFRQRL